MSNFYPLASDAIRYITVTLDDEPAYMLIATTVAPTHALASFRASTWTHMLRPVEVE